MELFTSLLPEQQNSTDVLQQLVETRPGLYVPLGGASASAQKGDTALDEATGQNLALASGSRALPASLPGSSTDLRFLVGQL